MRGDPKVEKVAARIGLPNGRLISWSKSAYRKAYPDHLVLFNASIGDATGSCLWWGDLDVSLDEEKLVALAAALEKTLYVFAEADTHWVEHLPVERATVVVELLGQLAIGRDALTGEVRAFARRVELAADEAARFSQSQSGQSGQSGDLLLMPEGVAVGTPRPGVQTEPNLQAAAAGALGALGDGPGKGKEAQ
jgi:hypothetical protein